MISNRHIRDTRTTVAAGRSANAAASSLGVRWSSAIVLTLALLLLAACGASPGETPATAAQTGGGGINPEAVAHSFFEDLSNALKDSTLVRDESRSYWVERLSGYFAPNE